MPDLIIYAIVAVTIASYTIIAWLTAGIIYRKWRRHHVKG